MRRVSRATRILRLVQDRAGITARLHRDLLYSPLESHFLKGILVENTPYKDTVYLWTVCMPLYCQFTFVVLSYSKRIGNVVKGGYLLVWGFRLSSVIQCSGPFNIKRAEGEPALVRGNVALRPCIRLDPGWIHTMKQSFASAARLRGGRDPFSIHGIKAKQIRGFCHLGS